MSETSSPATLNQKTLVEGVSYLTKIDADLAKVVLKLGKPPLWSREPGFPTLLHIILEQQVSLASAKATFIKLQEKAGLLSPERFLELTDIELREIGFSRQKRDYGRKLSIAILNGELDLELLSDLDDTAVRSHLIKIKGIGLWTANIYLLMALLRPDIWPTGDLALAKAVEKVKKLPAKPTTRELSKIAEQWQPWRGVATRILWHDYLNG